jgi:hypothetical protein
MPHMTSRPRPSFAAAAALLAVLASLVLAACGGSTSTTATTTATTAGATTSASTTPSTGTSGSSTTTPTTTTTKAATPGAGPSRFTALRECLQKNGITLPKRKAGQTPGSGAGGFLGGAPKLPAGVSRTQYQAAVKKCGGLPRFPRGGFRGPRIKFNSPTVRAALAKFAACLRANGVNVPEANTSGKGPIFNTKGLNTNSAAFRAAETKCRSDLVGAFRARPGAGGAAGGSSAAG